MAILDKIFSKPKREEFIARDNSKSQVKSFAWGSPQQNIYPNFSLARCEAMINDDPVARGALKHQIDRAMEGGASMVKLSNMLDDSQEMLRLNKKFMFREKIIREIVRKLILYNNAFVEIVRNPTDNKVIGLNVLDTTVLEPQIYPNGDLKSLYQTPVTGNTTPIEWNVENIVWIKSGDKAKGFAPIDLQSLWETLLAKSYVKQFVSWLWQTGQYRIIHKFQSGSESDINDFKVMMKAAEKDFRIPGLLRGEMESKVLRDMEEQESIIKLLDWYDSQILIEMRVSPVDAGKPDESGRSAADASQNAGDAYTTSLKKTVEDYINYELFKKMGIRDHILVFEPNNRFSVTKVLENVQLMKSAGFTNDACLEYMNSRGLYFETKEVFNEAPDMGNIPNPRDKDNMPSRVGKGSEESNQNQEEITTRPDQIGEN